MNMRALPSPERDDAFAVLVDRLRSHEPEPPRQYRCGDCLDSGYLHVPHPLDIAFERDEFGDWTGGWKRPCRELTVACHCPDGSAKYASINDWLREQKKPTRLWSIRDYLNQLTLRHDAFRGEPMLAEEWAKDQTPARKAAILGLLR